MASANDSTNLQRANFRLCRLCSWPNYNGLGFNLENTNPPPHIIRSIESNSPASAAGLRILDVLLAVNNQDVSAADYRTTSQAIRDAQTRNNRVELLVIERRFYVPFQSKGMVFNPNYARIMDTPPTMPREYENFVKYRPRTCEIQLNKNDESFGFEVVNGARDVGVWIQDVVPNSPAGRTVLRRCDRLLEVDGKFVDSEPSAMIFERLKKAKKKRVVKLYVVDTHTYKYFQERRVPLPSKDFRKSGFIPPIEADRPTAYINVADVNNEPGRATVDTPRPTTYPIPTPESNYQSSIRDSTSTLNPPEDDIRLCTITRTNAADTYGIELNYHRREQYHSLKLSPSPSNMPTNAVLAGVKTDDHLIEINGVNIENIGDDQVKQRIRAVQYPQPLQLLVADEATYDRYRRQGQTIHSGLPNVRRLPGTVIERSVSFSRIRQGVDSMPVSGTTVSSSAGKSPTGVGALVVDIEDEGRSSLENSLTTRQQFQLYRVQGVPTYGFSVMTNQGGLKGHRITEILPNSPAAQQGLRVGDNILTVNNQDVTQMNAGEFTRFLRTSAQNADARSQPLVLEVTRDDVYPSSPTSNTSVGRPTEQPPSTIPTQVPVPAKPPHSANFERRTSQNPSRRSTSTDPTTSHRGSQRLPITPLLNPPDGPANRSSTRPIVSRNGSQKAAPTMQPAPYQNGGSSYPSNQMPSVHTYPDEYDSSRYSRQDVRANETTSSPYRSLENLTRGAVDLVSRSRLLRYCQLFSGPSQAFGFQLKADDDKHIIYNIQPDSPAMRAGLSENDRLLEVDDENVEGKSTREVALLIRNAANNGKLRVLIAPSGVKVLSRRSARSLTALNDTNYSRNSTIRSKYDDQYSSSSVDRYRSSPSRRPDERNYQHRSTISKNSNQHLSEPSEPLPRKCVLQRDPNFRGCGFQLAQKHDCDTPIVLEIAPDSPAKRSGLTESDHIIYIDSQNVQNFDTFDEITRLIQRSFDENGEVTLITLTDPAYRVLRRRGGYLESTAFDYQARHIDQLKPRLCQLKLYHHQYDFGFALHEQDFIAIKDIRPDSAAESFGLRKGDVILEVNGRSTKYLSMGQIQQMIETSKAERKLDLLVIDPDGYRFSLRHAIPLNSYLSFVERGEEQVTTTNPRHSHPPVYL